MAFNKKSVPVSHDILREKQQQVESLERQADDAVELVTRTINRLELINQQIDDAMTEIDTYAADLAKTRETMSKQRQSNAAIINNFTKLLGGDEAEAKTEATTWFETLTAILQHQTFTLTSMRLVVEEWRYGIAFRYTKEYWKCRTINGNRLFWI